MPYRPFGRCRSAGGFVVGDQWPDPPAGLPPMPGPHADSDERPFLIGSLSRTRPTRTSSRMFPDYKLIVATAAVIVGTLAFAAVVLLLLLVALER